ncbi:MAG: hypothetical protein OXL96_28250 [Candidatus Poribacteria bacterium]|nr:hypothetical protein [Candidatus Poribacteria bacterium]
MREWAVAIAGLKAPASYYLYRYDAPPQLKLATDFYFETLTEKNGAATE